MTSFPPRGGLMPPVPAAITRPKTPPPRRGGGGRGGGSGGSGGGGMTLPILLASLSYALWLMTIHRRGQLLLSRTKRRQRGAGVAPVPHLISPALVRDTFVQARPSLPTNREEELGEENVATDVEVNLDGNNSNGKGAPLSTCALLFFGLPRQFASVVYPTIRRNLLDTNPDCDIFAHMYNVTTVVGDRTIVGMSRAESGGTVNASEIHLLVPPANAASSSRLVVETEEEFRRARNLTYYRRHFPTPSMWDYPTSMDNMVRQWHSIELVWGAMERHVATVRAGAAYDKVGLFRSDVIYVDPIKIEDVDEAVIPTMMYRPLNWGGLNDRLFYGRVEYARIWATDRFSSVEGFLSWQERNTNTTERRGLHSEAFMEYLLTVKHGDVFGRARRPSNDGGGVLVQKEICFKRVRSTGVVHRDCRMIKERQRAREAAAAAAAAPAADKKNDSEEEERSGGTRNSSLVPPGSILS